MVKTKPAKVDVKPRRRCIAKAKPAKALENCVGQATRINLTQEVVSILMRSPKIANKVVEFARAHGLTTIIDSTFATPVNFKPLAIGYDLVVHSATKYLNGHSDLAAGAVAGRGELVRRVKLRLDHLGGSLDPHGSYLLYRGLKTLALRVRYQNESAWKIAHFLEGRDEIEHVNYPGLESHPQHAVAAAQMALDGTPAFGGMITIFLKGGLEESRRFLEAVRIFALAESLGGVESLIEHPAIMTHASVPPDRRAALGISDSLIRLSVGIEDVADLLADLTQALD